MRAIMSIVLSGVILFSFTGCNNINASIFNRTTSQNSSTITSVQASSSDEGTQIKREYWPTREWKISKPEDQGMDEAILSEMKSYISKYLPHIRSVIVVRHGYIVFEEYFNGANMYGLYAVNSDTKTFTAALLGVAIKEGSIKNTDEKLSDYLPQYYSTVNNQKAKDITLKHLLTMTSGYAWNDTHDFNKIMNAADSLKTFINLPLSDNPGEKFVYNSAGSNALSAVITKATGKRLSAYADKYLFNYIGIKNCRWMEHQGYTVGAYGLELTPRDMARFGYLLLNQGFWDGKQLIPSEWIKEMTTVQNNGGSPEGVKYGYQCWITKINDYDAYFAGGYGGEFILNIPELDITVAISSKYDVPHMENRGIVGRFIVPAAKTD